MLRRGFTIILDNSRIQKTRFFPIGSKRSYALFKDLPKSKPVPPRVNSNVDSDTFESQTKTQINPEKTPQESFLLQDSPIGVVQNSPGSDSNINWSDSFHGLGSAPFPREINEILLAPLNNEDIEIKPDGLLYLPEIRYRRILNRAFGPGGWGLAPRTESLITPKQISREYALICHGRLVSVARGEQDYYGGEEKITTALEGCKSNALMRCCKDLGIASELWDPSFIKQWKAKHCDELFGEHITTKKKKKLWKLKRNKTLDYPYKMV